MEPVVRRIGKDVLSFELTGDYVRITELFGIWMGDDGGETDRRWMDGMWLLATDADRYEARDFKLVEAVIDERQAELTCAAAEGAIGLRSCWEADEDNAVLTRRDVLRNNGKCPLIVRRVLPRMTFPCGEYEIYVQRCLWNNENQGRWVPLHAGSLTLTSGRGRATDGCAPYACLRDIKTGRGVAVHLLPVGNWVLRLSARSLGNRLPWLVLEAGMADEDLRLELAPGGELVLPEIMLQPLPDGDPRAAAPRLHRHLRARLPAPPTDAYPVIYNSWLDRFGELDEAHLRRQALAAREAGCEVFVIDAGWYGRDDDGTWFTRMGDWREKLTGAFNGRMREFADDVRAMGMDFGLWIEPERFGAGSPVVREHPEWFLPSARGYLRMDLSRQEARDFRYHELLELVERYQLRYMKMDCNVELGYDPSGSELHDYFRHWYALLDRLRLACPRTVIENCASGGMRADLASLLHYDLYFPSDTANPVDLLRIREGGFLRLPPGRTLNWAVLKSVGSLPSKTAAPVLTPLAATWRGYEGVPLDFVLHAALLGVFGLSGDLSGLSGEVLRRIRWAADFYKARRAFIVSAAARILTPLQPIESRRGWTAFALLDETGDRALVYVFRVNVDGGSRRRFPLPELDPGAHYRVECLDPEHPRIDTHTGQCLTTTGLEVCLPYEEQTMFQSALYELTRRPV